MFKKRSIQVKLVPDQDSSAEPIIIDAEKIVDQVVSGVVAVILIHKLTGLFCSSVEHVIVTKVK